MQDFLLLLYALPLAMLVGELISATNHAIPAWMEHGWRRQCCCDDLTEADQYGSRFGELVWTVKQMTAYCPHCHSPFTGYRRIALLNWLLHSNECPTCGEHPSNSDDLYPQLIVVPVTLLVILSQGLKPQMLLELFQAWGWIAIAFISLRHQLIPDVLTYLLLWLALLSSALGLSVPLEDAVLGAAACYALPWLAYHLVRIASKQEILGYGVFKAGAAIGALLGLELGLYALAAAFALKAAENMIRSRVLITEDGLVPMGHWLGFVAVAGGLAIPYLS